MIMLEQITSFNVKMVSAMAGIVAHLNDLLPGATQTCWKSPEEIKSKIIPISKLESTLASERIIRNNPSLAPKKLGRMFCILRADKTYWHESIHKTLLTADTGETYVREKKLPKRAEFPFIIHPHLYDTMEELIIEAPSKALNALVGDGLQTFKDYFKLFEETAKSHGLCLYASYREEDSLDDFGLSWKRKSFRFFMSDRHPSESDKGSPMIGMSFTITLETK